MIELKNIEKSYDNHNVLHNFNYQFKDNKSYALVGKSGSGKTTLLNIIGRLELPDKGDILIDDDNLKTIPERRYFKDYLGYLFQNYGLIDNESIKDNLKLAFIGKKLKNQDQEIIMSKALSKVGLENYKHPLSDQKYLLKHARFSNIALLARNRRFNQTKEIPPYNESIITIKTGILNRHQTNIRCTRYPHLFCQSVHRTSHSPSSGSTGEKHNPHSSDN